MKIQSTKPDPLYRMKIEPGRAGNSKYKKYFIANWEDKAGLHDIIINCCHLVPAGWGQRGVPEFSNARYPCWGRLIPRVGEPSVVPEQRHPRSSCLPGEAAFSQSHWNYAPSWWGGNLLSWPRVQIILGCWFPCIRLHPAGFPVFLSVLLMVARPTPHIFLTILGSVPCSRCLRLVFKLPSQDYTKWWI